MILGERVNHFSVSENGELSIRGSGEEKEKNREETHGFLYSKKEGLPASPLK